MADLASSRVFGNLKVTGVLNGDGSGLTGTASLRATGTTASDVGLGSVDNYSRAHYDGRYLAAGGKAVDADKLDGKHASAFALTSGSYSGLRARATTKADVGLSNVDNYSRAHYDNRYLAAGAKAVDSDKLDGKHASAFAPASHTHSIANVSGLQTALDGKSSSSHNHDADYVSTGNGSAKSLSLSHLLDSNGVILNYGNSSRPRWKIGYNASTGKMEFSSTDGDSRDAWKVRLEGPSRNNIADTDWRVNGSHRLWNEGNQGPGSGMDADTVDGKHASSFALTSGTYSGLRARSTTKGDVGLGNVGNYSRSYYDGRYIRSSGVGSQTIDGGTNTSLTLLSNDGGNSEINLHGDNQGTGAVYVGQSTSHGGGIFYNGDGTPNYATGEGSDKISFFRRSSGTNYVVFDYSHSNNNVNFKGTISSDGSITAAGDITASSDIRIKTNIEAIPNALDKVSNLSGYTYDRTDMETRRQTGVIAQEVLEVLPEAVIGGPTDKDPDGHYSVAYGNMVGLLIEALKEEKSKRESLENRLEKLEALLGEQN